MRSPFLALAAAGAVLGACSPQAERAAVRPAPEIVAEQPDIGPVRPFVLPPVEDFRLANGMRVVALRQGAMPLVTARLLVDAGAEHEPADRNGLAVLAAELLTEGSAEVPGPVLAQRMERLGARFHASAGMNVATVTVTALKPSLGEALRLAAGAVMDPAFPERDFERVRQQAVSAHVRSQSTVEGLANETFARAVFAPSAPYSRPAGGTAETLRAVTRDDVVRWHRDMYLPRSATLLLVGDLAPGEARRLAEEAFGEWHGGSARPPRPSNAARAASGTRVILVDRPGSVQSAIRIGHATIGAEDADYLPLLATTHVLGGGFNARVNMNLRERRGWTYGAWAAFAPQRGAGTVLITSSVQTAATDSAVSEAVREFREIAAVPVPAEELRGATGNLAGSFPASVLTVQGLAQRIQNLLVWELPLDFWAGYGPALAALAPDDISEVAARRLRPGELTVVVAGDLSVVEAPMRALELGPVEVWSAGGERLR